MPIPYYSMLLRISNYFHLHTYYMLSSYYSLQLLGKTTNIVPVLFCESDIPVLSEIEHTMRMVRNSNLDSGKTYSSIAANCQS